MPGSRLTAYELVHDGLPATLVVDAAAGSLMAAERVDAVVTGADRIAANGDTANKIGTLSLAVNAARHGCVALRAWAGLGTLSIGAFLEGLLLFACSALPSSLAASPARIGRGP